MAKREEATLILKLKDLATKGLKRAQGAAGRFGNAMKTLGRLAITAAAGLGTFAAGAMKLGRLGSQFDAVKLSFRNMAASQGQDADKILRKMQEMSRGTVSDLDLMKQANTALMLGLPVDRFDDILQIARSASIATGESMDFMLNSIVTGLGRGSKLMLDNLGIVFDLNKANEEYAASLGKTASSLTDAERKQAFINKALEIGKQNAQAAGNENLTLSERFDQVVAKGLNLAVVIGQNLGPSFKFLLQRSGEAFDRIDAWVRSSSAREMFISLTKGVAFLKAGVEGLGAAIGVGLAGAMSAATEAFNLNFSKSKEMLALTMEELGTIAKEKQMQINEDLKLIDELYNQEKQEIQEQRNTFQKQKEDQAQKKQITDLQKHQAKLLGIDLTGAKNRIEAEEMLNKSKENARRDSLSTIATLQQSGNKTMAAIGKAAALTQIAIDTPVAIGRALAAFPPPFNFAAAAAVGAAMAAQAARVSGIALAEGGVVRATPGGIQATIGEGGRDEAVVPLPDDFDPDQGLGSGMTINFNGAILGDRAQAREFARVIDEELLNLRRSNESVAFDSDVI